jgi:hypothetical protein
MKRILFAAMLLVGVGALFGVVPAHAGVNDFTFKEFVGDYYLSKDTDGRSRLKVVETFTAEFPDFDHCNEMG